MKHASSVIKQLISASLTHKIRWQARGALVAAPKCEGGCRITKALVKCQRGNSVVHHFPLADRYVTAVRDNHGSQLATVSSKVEHGVVAQLEPCRHVEFLELP